MKKYFLLILLIIFLAAGYFVDQKIINQSGNNVQSQVMPASQPKIETTKPKNAPNKTPEQTLPKSYQIKNVPFQSQAPFANWDELHDEACEEASIIIVNAFLKKQSLSAQLMDEQILKLVDWEINKWGSHKDLNIEEANQMAKDFYGLNAKILTIDDSNDLKNEIINNHLVIAPTAGRQLGNPNFRQPGPVYHMLVISGFDQNNFITQDVGTKNGQNYVYYADILLNAIHDWPGSPEQVQNGAKKVLVFY